MLYFPNTRIFDSVERAIYPGQTVNYEGQPLIAVESGGSFGVQPCAGNAGERFAGVSLAQVITPTSFANVEQPTVGSGLTYTLAYTPTSGVYIYDVTAAAALTTHALALTGTGQYNITGTTLTTYSDTVGHVLYIAYRYSPTLNQIRFQQGDEPAGRAAAFTLGSIGVITRGDIYTDQFDTTAAWSSTASPAVTLGASGLFSIGGSGTVVNGYVTSIPSASSPFLGLHFTA